MMVASVLCTEAQTLIDGLYYNLDTEAKTASVAKNPSASGDIVIPSIVEYDGASYAVTTIGDGAFTWCTGLTSIVIPNSVESVGNRTFWNCSNLKSIELSQSITSIGDYTFSNCTSLSSFKIPDLVENIGTGAFSSCSSLSSVELPATLTNIEQMAFYNCSNISQLISKSKTPPTVHVECFYYLVEYHLESPLYLEEDPLNRSQLLLNCSFS